jgi:hypothetical protein
MGVRKKSALIKFLIFFGEMSVMTNSELNELVISYGLKEEKRVNYIYCLYKKLVVLMYDISDGKTAVWMGGGFSYYMDLKSDIELKLKNTIIEFKKVELENKLVKIGEDF